MKHLDYSVLEAIAEFICGEAAGAACPYRSMSEIEKFFDRAGIDPQGESGTRKWFVLQSLEAINGTDELEQVLLRLTSPKEYKADAETTVAIIDGLNQVLQIEGLEVALVDWEPTLQETSPSAEPVVSEEIPLGEAPDFEEFVSDSALAEILSSRWAEAEICVRAGACLSAIVMMGSVLEGLLLHKAERDPKTANQAKCSPKDPTGKVRPLRKWDLFTLIEVAKEVGWLQGDVHAFSHALRDYRNIVHPFKQRDDGARPDDDTCSICWQVVRAAIADIKESSG
jgi:hypothetical protein